MVDIDFLKLLAALLIRLVTPSNQVYSVKAVSVSTDLVDDCKNLLKQVILLGVFAAKKADVLFIAEKTKEV